MEVEIRRMRDVESDGLILGKRCGRNRGWGGDVLGMYGSAWCRHYELLRVARGVLD